MLFCDAWPNSFTTSASYPKANIRAVGISWERKFSGQEEVSPSAVHVVV
jgi:hypothetical protein